MMSVIVKLPDSANDAYFPIWLLYNYTMEA